MNNSVLYVRDAGGHYVAAKPDVLISAALKAMGADLRQPGAAMGNPDAVRQFLQMRLGALPHEMFGVMFIDSQNRLIEFEEMFRGTLSSCSVYPREVAVRALHHRAASVILAHNHPSNDVTPSRADERLTATLKAALALIDVQILDHIVVGADRSMSMAERGLV